MPAKTLLAPSVSASSEYGGRLGLALPVTPFAAWGHQPGWTGAGFVSAPPAPVPGALGLLLVGLAALAARRIA